jgi:predicted nucleic acid-binding protein
VSGSAVIDAGVAIGWIQGRERSRASLDRLFRACRTGRIELRISVVNLAEVLIHTADLSRETGVDAIALLAASRVRIHQPDESVARRVARLRTSLADGFAAATAQELGARLHTTDAELIRQLRGTRLPITHH